MILQGEKIKLRAIEQSDCQFLLGMINDPKIEEMVIGWSFPVSEREQLEWINNLSHDFKNERFVVEYETKPVGMVILSNMDLKNSTVSLGIKLTEQSRGLGIGTQAIKLAAEYCFNELNFNCITASILEYNISSQKLYQKCGFKKEGVLRKRIYKKGKYHDIYSYSVLKEEYM